jgi:methylglutaconyl-CoA hydratase
MIAELTEAFHQSNSDPEVKLVLLEGAGTAFCAGLDLEELKSISAKSTKENIAEAERLAALFHALYTHSKLTVSKIQGVAFAGGCGLATLCDIAVASEEDAKFCYSETKIGFVPALVAVFLLRRTRNAGIREMLLRANVVSATDAQRLGLIAHSISNEHLHSFVQQLCAELLVNTSAEAIALTKKLIRSVESLDLDEAIQYAIMINSLSRTTDDLKKGIQSFLNKEKLNWAI